MIVTGEYRQVMTVGDVWSVLWVVRISCSGHLASASFVIWPSSHRIDFFLSNAALLSVVAVLHCGAGTIIQLNKIQFRVTLTAVRSKV